MTQTGRKDFSFNPSRQLELCILFGHGVTIVTLVFVPIPEIACCLLLVILLLSALYFVLRDARLILPKAIVAMSLEGSRIVLFNRAGEELEGKLLPSSLIMPQIVILNIVLPNYLGRKNVVLMPDSMDADTFRQLRVLLKWGISFSK